MKVQISSVYEVISKRGPKVVAVVSEHLDRAESTEEGETKWVHNYRPREQIFLNELLAMGIRGIAETEAALDDKNSRLFDSSIELCFVVGEEFNRCSGIAMRIAQALPGLRDSIFVEIFWPLDSAPARNRVSMALSRVGGFELIRRLVVLTKSVPPPRRPDFEGITEAELEPGTPGTPGDTEPVKPADLSASATEKEIPPLPKPVEEERSPRRRPAKGKPRLIELPPPRNLPSRDPEMVRAMIPVFAPPWAEIFGEDDFGIFAEFQLQGVPFVWRWIPPGTFLMGSPKGDRNAFPDEQPQHEVTISEGFWLGETPVTQDQWAALTGEQPSHFRGPRRPVESVDWPAACAFAQRLSAALPGLWASLPTEAQWEYACRAGTQGDFYDGSRCTQPDGRDPALDGLGWFRVNSPLGTQEVKQKAPNVWGLFDLLGNVWEWCLDAKRPYDGKSQVDPRGAWVEPARGVVRGGAWIDPARGCRAACRGWSEPGGRGIILGFRLAAGQEPRSAEPTGAERPAVRPEGRGRTAEAREAIAIAAVRECLETVVLDRSGRSLRFTADGEPHFAEEEYGIESIQYLAANDALHRHGQEPYVRAEFSKLFARARAPFAERLASLWREVEARQTS